MPLRKTPAARATAQTPPHPTATASLAATSRRDRSFSSPATSSNLRLIAASAVMPHRLSRLTYLISSCNSYFLTTPLRTSAQTLIVSIGRLERYKGHQRLITALPKIREWRSDVRLLILGAGPYEANLREFARGIGVAEHVGICSVSARDRQGMAEILLQAAIVALLSEYETPPIAV